MFPPYMSSGLLAQPAPMPTTQPQQSPQAPATQPSTQQPASGNALSGAHVNGLNDFIEGLLGPDLMGELGVPAGGLLAYLARRNGWFGGGGEGSKK